MSDNEDQHESATPATPDEAGENGTDAGGVSLQPLPLPDGIGTVNRVELEQELRSSYLDYAMSVIVSRALPDARDGLKPVHRRILYAMHEGGYEANKPYRKSARVVGDVIGKYHPHSNDPIYEALVRMAQDFSLLIPLLDGQGNFGSVDGDPPAAMRYTEIRLAKVAAALLEDINRDTVDFQPNYDGSESEPSVLPARLPNLLVNGSGGIAVGMATNIPPHNLGEVLDACLALMADPELPDAKLFGTRGLVKGPDFPTGGIILGTAGIISAYETGKGRVVIRSRVTVESIGREREALIVSEIPYQVNKSTLIERIAELARDKKIEGISDIRDESDRRGMRIVIELKRDTIAEVVRNQLFQYSALQSSFSCNMVALDKARPRVFNLRHLIMAFIEFRLEVITRRTRFLLQKARDRAHIVAGLSVAVANIDEVVKIIRHASSPADATEKLLAKRWHVGDMAPLLALIDDPRHHTEKDGKFALSLPQVKAILDLRLHRLTGLGREEIGEELTKLSQQISHYLDVLSSRDKLMGIAGDEIEQVRENFAQPRRSEIVPDDSEAEVDIEDLIQREEVVVTVSRLAYIKRVALSTYRSQRRGGKGRAAMATREEDWVTRLFVASTHTPVLFFASGGKVYKMKVWRLPVAQPQARGKPIINLLPITKGERINSILPLPENPEESEDKYLIFATRNGYVRRNRVSDFTSINRSGKIAMRLEDDELVEVLLCREDDDLFITTAQGRCLRCSVKRIRVFAGRGSRGVTGIKLRKGDRIISMCILRHTNASPSERAEYLKQARRNGEDTGDTSAASAQPREADTPAGEGLSAQRYNQLASDEQFLLTVSANGYGKRTSSYEYRNIGRGAQGFAAMTVNERNGNLVASFPVSENDQIMLVTDHGRLIRFPINEVRISGRATQGVRLLNIPSDERIVAVERVPEHDSTE